MSDYILDFEVINRLTTHPSDDPEGGYGGKYMFSISKKIIREYIDIFLSNGKDKSVLKYVTDTLEYNGIIVHKSKLRDKKINKILNEDNAN